MKKLRDKYSLEECKIINVAFILILIGVIMSAYWIGHAVGYKQGEKYEFEKIQQQYIEYISNNIEN